MVGVAAMLPLMQLITGVDPTLGPLGFVARTMGTTDTRNLIVVIALAVGLAFALKSIITVGFRWWLLGHTTRLEAEAAAELMRRYVLAPYWAHREREIATINRNLDSSVAQTFGQVILGLVGILADVLTLVGISAVLVLVSPVATLFTVVTFGLLGWALQQSLRKRHLQIGRLVAQSNLDAWSALMPGLHGFREARLASSAEVFVNRFTQAKGVRAHANRLSSITAELPKYVLEIGFVVGIAAITLLLFTAYSAEFALSVLGVFAAASVRLLPTVNRVVATIGIIRAGRAGLEILSREVKDLEAAGYHSEKRRSDEQYSGDLALEDVTYSYRGSQTNVLERVTVTISAGMTTAIVGSSGAGKSTLLNVLLGLLEPEKGEVTCGGRSIFDDLPGWYSTLGVVPQDVYLLDDSLQNNIAFGENPKDINPARLTAAVELAQLSSLVDELPNGFETRLGERGVRLSGGQKQRIGIARALYRSPSILVLDEATSALDNATEQRISETIASLSGRMTVVIVAHRLSTVKNADKIIFMSGGRVVAAGSFEEVQASSSDFAHLVAIGKLE